jgi:hypothetical protein
MAWFLFRLVRVVATRADHPPVLIVEEMASQARGAGHDSQLVGASPDAHHRSR